MFTIYKITNKLNNKIYIGMTKKDIKKRFDEHWYDRNKKNENIPLRKALSLNKKTDFKIESIECCDNIKEANLKEKFYIKKFNSIENGYNISTGGIGGDTLSNNINLDIIKEKIKKSKIGKNNHNSKSVDVFFNDKFLIKFESAGEATRFFISKGIKIAESSVKRKCSGIIKNNRIENYKVYWSKKSVETTRECREAGA